MMFYYTNKYLIAAAIIPAIILLVRVYKADKYEKEPPELLVSLVIWGILATVLAVATEQIGIYILPYIAQKGTVLYNALLYFVVVAVSEEGFKYLILKWRTWNHPAFNYSFDAVVYAVFVSMGFALWENVQYVTTYGMRTAMLRAVTAVPGHACFGVFMGMWYGFSKKYFNRGNLILSKICGVLAFLLPAVTHGCYDYIATIESEQYSWIFIAFIAVMFVIAMALVQKLSKKDENIL